MVFRKHTLVCSLLWSEIAFRSSQWTGLETLKDHVIDTQSDRILPPFMFVSLFSHSELPASLEHHYVYSFAPFYNIPKTVSELLHQHYAKQAYQVKVKIFCP